MINLSQFREFIIKPALFAINYYNPDLEELLVGICAHESKGGTYIHQTNGSALGIYQMEPNTHNMIWDNFLIKIRSSAGIQMYDNILLSNKMVVALGRPDATFLMNSNFYATQLAAAFIYKTNQPFPKRTDVEEIARYWKTYWNTKDGKGLESDFIKNYENWTKD